MNGLSVATVIALATKAMGHTDEDISNFIFRFEQFKDDKYQFTPDEMFNFANACFNAGAVAERELRVKANDAT